MKLLFATLILSLSLTACRTAQKEPGTTESKKPAATIESAFFGTTAEGDSVQLFTLKNKEGIVVKITNYGGIITELHTPDRDGKPGNIVLGYDHLEPYLHGTPYFGAIIGRYGNRIAEATFSLDGEQYQLAANDGNNSLHGGTRGFDKVVWDAEMLPGEETSGLRLTYISADGEEGYPGTLTTRVTYDLTGSDLHITYQATTDRPTVLNLTNHSYFNLAGEGTILDHVMYINASRYTPVNSELIPTGVLANVEGTPFDFRKPTPIGERLEETGGHPVGYDHNFILDTEGNLEIPAAKVLDPNSGRILEVHTTEPGIQFYSGNFLDESIHMGDRDLVQYAAFCLETQHFPDSPNQPEFPSTVLRPGEEFLSQTIFRFATVE